MSIPKPINDKYAEMIPEATTLSMALKLTFLYLSWNREYFRLADQGELPFMMGVFDSLANFRSMTRSWPSHTALLTKCVTPLGAGWEARDFG